jgi:hypothetical protein
MSTGVPTPQTPRTNGATAELNEWRDHARVFLQPIAAPSILGLYGFAAATFILTAYLVGWYGTPTSPTLIFPFAAFAGGMLQIIASTWAFRARDAVAAAVHGMWGAFWVAYGLVQLLVTVGDIAAPGRGAAIPELGYWLFALGGITFLLAFAAAATNLAVTVTLVALATGAGLLGVFYTDAGSFWIHLGGYVTMLSAFLAAYTATAMVCESTYGRVVLPVGTLHKAANIPGGHASYPIQFELGEPGVKQGQ